MHVSSLETCAADGGDDTAPMGLCATPTTVPTDLGDLAAPNRENGICPVSLPYRYGRRCESMFVLGVAPI